MHSRAYLTLYTITQIHVRTVKYKDKKRTFCDAETKHLIRSYAGDLGTI